MRGMLDGLRFLVLDEADRLLGKAFEREMDELLLLILLASSSPSSPPSSSGADRTRRRGPKTLLFSATFPGQIEARVDRVLSRMRGHRRRAPAAPVDNGDCPVAGPDRRAPARIPGRTTTRRRSRRPSRARRTTPPVSGIAPSD